MKASRRTVVQQRRGTRTVPRRGLATRGRGAGAARRAAVRLALAGAACVAFAGAARAGSQFSYGGLGEWVWPSDVRGAGMGGVGASVPDKRNLSLVNPAAAAFVEQPTIYLSMATERRNADDGRTEFKGRGVDFPLLRGVAFPPGGVRLTAALHQWNHTEFEMIAAGPPDTLFGSIERAEGTGGFTALAAGAAMRPVSWLAVGLSADFPFGSYRETWRREFPDSLGLVDSADRLKGTPGSKPSWTVGAIGIFGRATLGAYFRPARDIDFEEELSNISGDVVRSERTFHFPMEAGGGVSVLLMRGLRIGVDAARSPWSEFEVDGAAQPGFRDVTRIGAGLEWVRDPSPRARFLRRVPLRLGYYQQPWHFRDAEGNDIDERFVTLGLGIPFSRDNGMFDAAVEIGRRGDLDGNGLEESIIRLTLGVTHSRVDTRQFPQ